MDDAGLYSALLRRGMTRRTFLRFTGAMAAALALPATAAPRIAAALEAAPRLPVIWVRGQTCGGNTESFLRSADPGIETLLLDTLAVEYHQSLLAVAGNAADQARADARAAYPGGYVAVIEGAIPDGASGAYCLVGGRPVREVAREVIDGALAVIAVGSCAVDGGAPAASGGLTDARGVGDLVGDRPYIALPGCPMNTVNLVAVLVHYLTAGTWPPLDLAHRPLSAYGNLIHNECERRPHFEFGEFALTWGDEGAQRGWCLYKVGCKGPQSMGNCPTARYGAGVSWNIRAGHGCIGCVTPDFWDQMGPAHRHLPPPVPFLPWLTTDLAGAALVGGVAAVAGAHAIGMSLRFKRRARLERRQALELAAAVPSGLSAAEPAAAPAGVPAAVPAAEPTAEPATQPARQPIAAGQATDAVRPPTVEPLDAPAPTGGPTAEPGATGER